MATSPLLSIPRKTTAEVDFGPAIKQIITGTYGEPADRYSEEIAILNRTRQDAVRGTAGSDTTARDLLYRYFGQLELLELRFPEIRVPFPWNDAFTPSKNISQLSLAYEKASVIFNIAATLSALAASQTRSSPEGLKRAFNFYRSSAGMFTYINENFLHAPSTDLGRDLIKILITLMTAQATEVFLERMTEEKRSPGLKSKVCAQCAAVYAGVVEELKEHVGKAIFDRSWLVLVQTKAKYFASLAQYNRALADDAASKYGDALARLTLAENLAKEAHRISLTYGSSFYGSVAATAAATLPPDAGSSLQELCKSLVTIVSEARVAALKDNDLVYHALVPSEASLPAIDKSANVAEPIPIQEIYASQDVQKLVGTDIFIKLVPLSVIESSSLYSEEKAKILRLEGEKADVADGELQTSLDHLGLPSSLAKFRSSANANPTAMVDPGPQIKTWSQEIRSHESEKRLEQYVSDLTSLRDKTTSDLEWSLMHLDQEQRECEQARVRFDHHFEQSPSSTHTRNWRTDIKNNRDALSQARQSDDRVLSLWTSVRQDIMTLAAGEDALEKVFAEFLARADAQSSSSTGSSLLDLDLPDVEGDAIKKSVAVIDDALSKLQKIKKERADVLADLKERIHNDDISQLLILNRKSQNIEPTLFAAELEKFRPHQARLNATVQAQQSTLQTLNSEFERLITSKKGKELQSRYARTDRVKKELSERFKRAFEAYREIRAGVIRGTTFYTELAQLLTSIRQEVAQFVSRRASERSAMTSSAEVRQRLSGSERRADGLETALGGMSLAASTPSPQNPNQWRANSGSGPQAYTAQHPSYAQDQYSGYSKPGFGNASSPSPPMALPPKPTSYPYAGSQPPPRSASGTGLPPPPQSPLQHSYQGSSMPPPPPAVNYPSHSSNHRQPPPPPAPASGPYSYSSPSRAQYGNMSGPYTSNHQSAHSAGPPSGYSSPPPPAPYPSTGMYGQPSQPQVGQYQPMQSPAYQGRQSYGQQHYPSQYTQGQQQQSYPPPHNQPRY